MRRAVRSVPKLLTLVFLLALTLLGANALLAWRNTQQLADDEAWVAHTHEVLTELSQLLSALKDAETGMRGYVITGEDRFRQPYDQALPRVRFHLDRVRELTADNDRQQARIGPLEGAIAARLAELEDAVRRRQEQGFEPARRVVLGGRGKAAMDDVRRVVAEMEHEEHDLLRLRAGRSEASYRWSLGTVSLATLGGVAFLGLTFFVLGRYLEQRRRTEQSLQEANATLERRVAERTAEIAASNRDLQAEMDRRRRIEEEREALIRDLQKALAEVNTLEGLLPMCAWCRKVRNDEGYWRQLEAHVQEHLDVNFTHGICPDCLEEQKAQLERLGRKCT
jgi:CHASE3 domain sensor protein